MEFKFRAEERENKKSSRKEGAGMKRKANKERRVGNQRKCREREAKMENNKLKSLQHQP